MMRNSTRQRDTSGRPQWWSVLLSLLVVLSLVVQPSHLCALMETAPGHSHAGGHSHGDDGSHADHHGEYRNATATNAHGDESGAGHHDDDHVGHAHQHDASLNLSSLPEPHSCCSDSYSAPVAVAAVSRIALPDAQILAPEFTLAVMPAPVDVFSVAGFHGRDGPDVAGPITQLSRASLLGLSPPISA